MMGKSVIQLADYAGESIAITELEPHHGQFIGKKINLDGSISEYPMVAWWRRSSARWCRPRSRGRAAAYLRAARTRNIC